MTITDYAWQRYADLQHRCREAEVNDYSWGLEAALNYLLNAIESKTIPPSQSDLEAALSRTIASGARLRRSRSMTLKRWSVPPELQATNSAAEASIELDRVRCQVKESDGEILLDAAFGFTDREIASRHASTPGAIRVRLSRLRVKLGKGLSHNRPSIGLGSPHSVSGGWRPNSYSESQAA